MKNILLAVGLILGPVAIWALLAANDHGLFDRPKPITLAALVQTMQQSEFDSHAEWFIEPADDHQFLITFQLPLKRRQYLIGKDALRSTEHVERRRKLTIANGQLATGPDG